MTSPVRATRPIALFLDGEKLRCPRGHPLPYNVWSPVLTAVRCTRRRDARSPMCGAIVLLFAWSNGIRCMVEVSHVEAVEIETQRMTQTDAAAYLGLAWPPSTEREYTTRSAR